MSALTQARRAVGRKSAPKKLFSAVPPKEVVAELEKHVVVDGFKLIFDTEKSHGSRFVDAATGREVIDLYSFYASQPVGYNHPFFSRPEVQADLLTAARFKVANADVYSVQYATVGRTFARVMGVPAMGRYFVINDGALAGRYALKAAMEWK